jgi:protein-S-isoprenylcysteine O-methyltransferase Ste14
MTKTETHAPLRRGNAIPWPPLLFLASIAAALVMTRFWPLPWPGINDAPAHWVGLGVGAAGIVLIAFGVKALLAQETPISPHKPPVALVTTGIYRRFRNPIYLGMVLLLFGGAEVTKSIWFVIAGVVFAVLVTLLQIVPEERELEARFGDAYLDYKSRSRRWI